VCTCTPEADQAERAQLRRDVRFVNTAIRLHVVAYVTMVVATKDQWIPPVRRLRGEPGPPGPPWGRPLLTGRHAPARARLEVVSGPSGPLTADGDGGGRRVGVVSTLEQPGEPKLEIYSPEEALRHAHPLPPREDLVIEDISDEQWAAFREALAET